MESSVVLRSFHCSMGPVSHIRSLLENPGLVLNANQFKPNKSCIPSLTTNRRLIYTPKWQKGLLVSSAKTPEAKEIDMSKDSIPQSSLEKATPSATFPNGFEALMLEVCDETEIAELKVKVGDFEMHLKRNVGSAKAPVSNISPISAPPIPSKPMIESSPAPPPPPPSPPTTSQNANPFAVVSTIKPSKMAGLEAFGPNTYVIVNSPTVGSFLRGRTVKGKKQPPICGEGDIVKEGQVIGYVSQFNSELPVRTDVGGEVLRLLVAEGEAVGYGDPVIAILPSFHGIK